MYKRFMDHLHDSIEELGLTNALANEVVAAVSQVSQRVING
jgi:hypothetical protein